MLRSHRTGGVVFAAVMLCATLCSTLPARGGAAVILDTSSFWRVHYTLKPPVVRRGDSVQPMNITAKWIRRESPPPAAGWPKPDFDDGAWARLPGVISGVFNYWGGTRGDPKLPFVARVCMRGKFTVSDPAQAGALTLSARYRGGLVVCLNGKEVARGHLGDAGPDGLATDYAEGEAHDRALTDVRIPAEALRKGTNVLAVDVHRAAYADKDIGRGRRNRETIEWGSCGLVGLRLEAAGGEGVAGGIARPKGLQVWNSDPMNVDCDLDYGDPSEPLRPVRIVAARNGAFSAKVVVGADRPIKGLTARVSDLKGRGGVVPASAVQVRYALPGGYQSGMHERRLAPASCFHGLEEFPPAEVPVRVKKPNRRVRNLKSPGVSPSFGAVQPVWVTVNVPADAAPGEYEGKLTIAAEGAEPLEVAVTLDVAGWKLPAPVDFTTWADIVESPESVALRYEVPLWSDAHFKLLEKSLKLLGQVGNKVAYIHLICRTNAGNAETMVRWIKQDDGTYKHDLAPMERYLDGLIRRGARPAVVCLYVWDTYLEGGRGGAEKHAGGATKTARAAHGQRGPLVSVIDAAGKVEAAALPPYSAPAKSLPLWRPLMKDVMKSLADRGLDKAAMLGVSTDNKPAKEVVAFFKEALPGAKWVSHGHAMPTDLHGVPVGYLSGVWAGGKFPADPTVSRTHGWRRTFSGFRSKEFSSPGGAVLVHHPRNTWSVFPVTAFRVVGEMNIAGWQRGFARLGADFWDVIEGRGGRRHSLSARYPETIWRNLDIHTSVLSPGRDGAVSTHRFEMLREGLQECEARIFIEKAILAKKIDGDLARRCQAVLDERIPAIRWGVSTLGCTGVWTSHAYIDNSWWQIPGVMGYNWYLGSGWQERSRKLYAAAAEVARALGE